MPYTLKPNKLFVKDPNGNGYLPQNVVTDRTTDDMVAEINEAGANQITAIGNKGTQTLETIPDDYTALSNQVNNLESAMIAYVRQIQSDEDVNTVVENGIYGISAQVTQTALNLPVLKGTCSLIVLNKAKAYNVAVQILIHDSDSSRNIYERMLNNQTLQVIPGFDWHAYGVNVVNSSGQSTADAISQKFVTDGLAGKVNNSDSVIRREQLARDTDLNTITDNGWYGFSSGVRQTLLNLPADVVSGTGMLICIKGTDSGSNVTTQLLLNNISGRCKVFERLLNNSTHVPLSGQDWRALTTELVDTTGQSTTSVMTQKAVTDAINAVQPRKSVWHGKTVVFFGDSRTWYDGHTYGDKTKTEWEGKTCVGYQQTVAGLLGCTVDSQGVSGNTSAQICARIKAYDFSNADAVFLEGGVNDFVKASSVTIGEIQPIGGSFNSDTVYGAWQSAIEYILTNYPSLPIYMDIPAIAWTSAGLFSYDVAKIKGEIAELYHLPCLDLYKNAGINEVNRDYWYCDDVATTNWRLHFNDYGNVLIGQKIAGFLASH